MRLRDPQSSETDKALMVETPNTAMRKATLTAPQALRQAVTSAGEEGQQGTLAKSLLASSLLCQGTPIISQDALQDPSLAAFVGTVVSFRQKHASLLQPHHFSSSRELFWHGATRGQCSLGPDLSFVKILLAIMKRGNVIV